MHKYKLKAFKNGLRLITAPMQGTQTASVFFLFGVGSRFERPETNGISHFLEHLMFKGTKKRPTTLHIAKALDRVGAEFNAMTSKDYTGYYVKINSEKIELGFDILSDMLKNSLFAAAEIKREKGVICEEINMYHDNPLMYVEDLLEQTIYQGNTLAWEIAGSAKSVQGITRQQILDYKNKYYHPKNTVLVVAGKIPTNVEQLARKYYVKNFKATDFETHFDKFCSRQNAPRVKVLYKDTKQIQLALGFLAEGHNSPEEPAQKLMTVILGGSMSSRLFTQVRERRGLAYFVRCWPNLYDEVGNIVIQAGLDKLRIKEAMQVIFKELKKMAQKGVTVKELKDAQEFVKGHVLLRLEDSFRVANWFAKQALFSEKILTPEQEIEKIFAVKPKQIQDLAKQIFQKNRINLAIIGPYKDAEYFQKIIQKIGL